MSLRVLEVARFVVDGINALQASATGALAQDVQLRRSAQSIAANVREAYGRRAGPERNQFLRFARGSAEEADEHLRAHVAQSRIPERSYWQLHHRIMLCIKMLNGLMRIAPVVRTRSKNSQ